MNAGPTAPTLGQQFGNQCSSSAASCVAPLPADVACHVTVDVCVQPAPRQLLHDALHRYHCVSSPSAPLLAACAIASPHLFQRARCLPGQHSSTIRQLRGGGRGGGPGPPGGPLRGGAPQAGRGTAGGHVGLAVTPHILLRLRRGCGLGCGRAGAARQCMSAGFCRNSTTQCPGLPGGWSQQHMFMCTYRQVCMCWW